MQNAIKILFSAEEINRKAWDRLVEQSHVTSWFQTPDAYGFFCSLSFLEVFCLAVENDGALKGVVVGFIQKDGGKIKQYLSRRAIINGGPLLADDITEEELTTLLTATKLTLKHKAIFIETRNFNDFSRWRKEFERCDFFYEPHLNIHVDCTDWEIVENNIGKHRKSYIRRSFRGGATIVDDPTEKHVRALYEVLAELYKTKIKKAELYPISFFLKLFHSKFSKFIIVEYNGQVVGGSVCVLLEGRTVYEWFACGRDKVNKNIYPSSVTKYAGMRFANENHYSLFDMMGAGKPDEEYGVRDFKAEFGGKFVEYGRFKNICSPLFYTIGTIGVKLLIK